MRDIGATAVILALMVAAPLAWLYAEVKDKRTVTRCVLGVIAIAVSFVVAWDLGQAVRLEYNQKHSVENAVREFARTGTILPPVLPENSNLVLGVAHLSYDEKQGSRDSVFRIALMIIAEDGSRIMDFFGGIQLPSEMSRLVGSGNAIVRIPKIQATQTNVLESVSSFSQDFPDFIGKEFQLTFKEFIGTTFYLEDVPKGRGYVWFQTSFDGNRVTQFPIRVDLEPKPGGVSRIEIRANGRELFQTL